MNRYTEGELRELKNLIGAVFYVDQTGDMKRKLPKIPELVAGLDYQELLTLLQWVSVIIKEWQPEGGSGLAVIIERYAALMEQDTRRGMQMFVSNFAEEVEVFMREEVETKARLSFAEQRWAQAEREKVQVQQEKAQAEREKAQVQQKWAQVQQEKAQVQQSFRQAVLLLKEMGIPPEEIARKTGLSQETIERMGD